MSIAAQSAPLEEQALAIEPVPYAGRNGSALLRWGLRGADGLALVLAWTTAEGLRAYLASSSIRYSVVLAIAAAGIALVNGHGLHLSRVATMRMVEQAKIMRVSVLLVGAGAGLEWALTGDVGVRFVLAGATLSFLSLILFRTTYRGWLEFARSNGRFVRHVLLVGIDDQAGELRQVFDEQPELGYIIVGAVGSYEDARRNGLLDLWLGDVDQLESLAESGMASGAVVSSTALDPGAVNAVTRSLLDNQFHVHVSTGLSGLDQRRLRSVHVGYEPLLYVEPVDLTRGQTLAKRAIDTTLTVFVLLLAWPVLAVSALLVKLNDGGPVLFRQQRVGREGRTFTLFKFRTMSVDAEKHLDRVIDLNQRDGPLFKLENDPRITRVGRVLRALSIDELPQLWNVLRGDMSLVGPRPALPSEVATFDERLRERTSVLPGITGLWQVEARDNPSFNAYRRLDLYYVDNWSVGLDAMVIVATIQSELSRLLRRVLGRAQDAT